MMSSIESMSSILNLLQGLSASTRPLLVILGPTASGKTAFSIEIATILRQQGIEAEILNGDSRQLYRSMDIGTAKIRPDEMRGIKHHLLDVLDPKEAVTAAWYKEQATSIINALHAKKHIPIIVGGSMLYVDAVVENLQFVSPSQNNMREELEKRYDEDEGKTLYNTLQEQDPQTAAAFHHKNKPYVIRAMEILLTTGKPSEAKKKIESPYQTMIIGLSVAPRQLAERIERRTTQLLEQGWMDEVHSLLKKGYTKEDPGMRSVGYREIIEAIEQEKTSGNDLHALSETISAKTRQYAKRQMTWWKRNDRIRWIDAAAVKNRH
jgi:tRNA dimethylallyltransferase